MMMVPSSDDIILVDVVGSILVFSSIRTSTLIWLKSDEMLSIILLFGVTAAALTLGLVLDNDDDDGICGDVGCVAVEGGKEAMSFFGTAKGRQRNGFVVVVGDGGDCGLLPNNSFSIVGFFL